MRSPNPGSIAQNRNISRAMFFAGLVAGGAFFAWNYAQGLTVAHYDAKAHLLVARRIVDSLEPGYAQIGVNWLPLVHLIYLPFVVFELQYRSGFLPSLISVVAFAISVRLAYKISFRLTESSAAGVFAGVVLMANPNLLYLQSCPLTEPVYMLLMLLAVDALIGWRESDHSRLPWRAAAWASLGALCRYEGWFFLAGVLLLLACDFRTHCVSGRRAIQAGAVYVAVFGVPMAAHFGYIYYRLGDNFFRRVAEGNPEPYLTYKRPFLSALYHLGELSQMAAILPLFVAAAGLLLFLSQRRNWKARAPLILLWLPSLINISALYWGLIYRLRYSVLLLPAVAIFGSLIMASGTAKKRTLFWLSVAVMLLPWICWIVPKINPHEQLEPGPGTLLLPAAALALFLFARARRWCGWGALALCVLGVQIPQLARENRPMMVETLEHEFIEAERWEVIRYLRQNYDGRRILIDMGRQAPLVYDSGLRVREFVYNEGGGVHWHAAFRNPGKEVGWLCAEKGDSVWQLMQNPGWIAGYSPVLKTDNFLVYRSGNEIRNSRFEIDEEPSARGRPSQLKTDGQCQISNFESRISNRRLN